MAENVSPASALDRAHSRRIQGDHDGALRGAIALLEASSEDLGAALLLCTELAEAKRTLVVGECCARLVEGFVRRGDLPNAAVAAVIADRAQEDGAALRGRIAAAFAKGSKRLADVPPAPPPLRNLEKLPAALVGLRGEALLGRGEKALQTWLSTEDPRPADAQVPILPLFATLSAAPLTELLAALEVREIAAGAEAIHQGEEGREAFVVARGALDVVRTDPRGETVLAALGPGAIFGEMALVSDAPRAAAVRANEPAVVLVAARTALEALASKQPVIGQELGAFCRGRMVANLVRHSAILCAVEPKQRANLVERFETRRFEAGEPLVKKGEEGGGLFLIASGTVEVSGQDAEGDRLRIAELGPGDVVGEISLVLRQPATADVVALHSTVALELRRDAFQQAIREHPTLLAELYDLATKREEETRSVVAQEALDVEDIVLL